MRCIITPLVRWPNSLYHYNELKIAKGKKTTKTLITEQVYVHNKMIISDDKVALIGTANINDRGMKVLGITNYTDSEIAAVVVDNESVNSIMDGKPACVRMFALDLRIKIWNEHLGLSSNSMLLTDPVSDDTYNFMRKRAEMNTKYFLEAFPGIPANKYPVYAAQMEDLKNRKSDKAAYKIVSKIKGHLVNFPFVWLWNETTEAGPWDGWSPDSAYALNNKESKKKYIG